MLTAFLLTFYFSVNFVLACSFASYCYHGDIGPFFACLWRCVLVLLFGIPVCVFLSCSDLIEGWNWRRRS